MSTDNLLIEGQVGLNVVMEPKRIEFRTTKMPLLSINVLKYICLIFEQINSFLKKYKNFVLPKICS